MFSLRNKKTIMWIPPLICSYDILEESYLKFRYSRLCHLDIPRGNIKAELFGNSGNPDQMPHSAEPHSAASHLGLHCFLVTLLGVPTLQAKMG